MNFRVIKGLRAELVIKPFNILTSNHIHPKTHYTAAQDVHQSQEVKDAFRNLKEAISLQCLNASGMTSSCTWYGERVIGLMESSPLSLEGELSSAF
jgi:hypothetical protein